MSKEFLFELGIEELPASYVSPSLEFLRSTLEKRLSEARLTFESISAFGTPRRLTLLVAGLAESQPDFEEVVTGPPKKSAVAADGSYTKAAESFASAQGVAVSDLRVMEKDKKEYVGFIRKNTGRPAAGILAEAMPEILNAIPFAKTMRWFEGTFRYARPVHWILAILGGEVVPFSLGDVSSGDMTWGHRFHANKPYAVKDFQNYDRVLRDASIVVRQQERSEIIVAAAEKLAASVGGIIERDDDLLETVTNLVEFPVPMLGSFEDRFLALPKEILVTTMKTHQKYFPVVSKDGKLMPHFIIVSNTNVPDPSVVVNGNNRVIRARFSDAAYYFEKDKLIPLASRVDGLAKVTFHQKLGSYAEKTERIRSLTARLAALAAPSSAALADRAALLSKADLVTGMVYEFPDLQGIIGGELAALHGEPADVAAAIREQYLPASPDDPVPSTAAGTLVSLADKLDNLVGFFGIGLAPKGASDPFGMRRAAIGFIRIIIEKRYGVDYRILLADACDLLAPKLSVPKATIIEQLSAFIENRFFYQLESQGFSTEVINGVMASHQGDLTKIRDIVTVMHGASKQEGFAELAFAIKRVANITKDWSRTDFSSDRFVHDTERTLAAEHGRMSSGLDGIFASGAYADIPVLLASMKPAIDGFFEAVMVMDKDQAIKENRLSLLAALRYSFSRVLDFTRIQI